MKTGAATRRCATHVKHIPLASTPKRAVSDSKASVSHHHKTERGVAAASRAYFEMERKPILGSGSVLLLELICRSQVTLRQGYMRDDKRLEMFGLLQKQF